jgi:hypothetical protein
MSVLAIISRQTVAEEIEACQENCKDYGWLISSVDEVGQLFIVTMTSPIDQEQYIIEFKFDNYPEHPYLIDFIHPTTGIKGELNAYPYRAGQHFFNKTGTQGFICNQCSRKSYAGYTGVHSDWVITNWKAGANGLINLNAILDAIYTRISNKATYEGRMV